MNCRCKCSRCFNPLPRRNEGRPSISVSFAPQEQFQSAPPVETRGDARARTERQQYGGFNPLPPSKRGETNIPNASPANVPVSIRSPRRNEGRLLVAASSSRGSAFQSAPPVETRGDLSPHTEIAAYPCFNPLPPSKRGETAGGDVRRSRGPVSIRSPRRNEGRLRASVLRTALPIVSIRSPRRNEGRHPVSHP